MPQQLSDGVNVSPLHSQPRRGRVSQVVEAKILDVRRLCRTSERHGNLFARHIGENVSCQVPAIYGECVENLQRQIVQINDSALAVLRLR